MATVTCADMLELEENHRAKYCSQPGRWLCAHTCKCPAPGAYAAGSLKAMVAHCVVHNPDKRNNVRLIGKDDEIGEEICRVVVFEKNNPPTGALSCSPDDHYLDISDSPVRPVVWSVACLRCGQIKIQQHWDALSVLEAGRNKAVTLLKQFAPDIALHQPALVATADTLTPNQQYAAVKQIRLGLKLGHISVAEPKQGATAEQVQGWAKELYNLLAVMIRYTVKLSVVHLDVALTEKHQASYRDHYCRHMPGALSEHNNQLHESKATLKKLSEWVDTYGARVPKVKLSSLVRAAYFKPDTTNHAKACKTGPRATRAKPLNSFAALPEHTHASISEIGGGLDQEEEEVMQAVANDITNVPGGIPDTNSGADESNGMDHAAATGEDIGFLPSPTAAAAPPAAARGGCPPVPLFDQQYVASKSPAAAAAGRPPMSSPAWAPKPLSWGPSPAKQSAAIRASATPAPSALPDDEASMGRLGITLLRNLRNHTYDTQIDKCDSVYIGDLVVRDALHLAKVNPDIFGSAIFREVDCEPGVDGQAASSRPVFHPQWWQPLARDAHKLLELSKGLAYKAAGEQLVADSDALELIRDFILVSDKALSLSLEAMHLGQSDAAKHVKDTTIQQITRLMSRCAVLAEERIEGCQPLAQAKKAAIAMPKGLQQLGEVISCAQAVLKAADKMTADARHAQSLLESVHAGGSAVMADLQGFVTYQANQHTRVLTQLAQTQSEWLEAVGGPKLPVPGLPSCKETLGVDPPTIGSESDLVGVAVAMLDSIKGRLSAFKAAIDATLDKLTSFSAEEHGAGVFDRALAAYKQCQGMSMDSTPLPLHSGPSLPEGPVANSTKRALEVLTEEKVQAIRERDAAMHKLEALQQELSEVRARAQALSSSMAPSDSLKLPRGCVPPATVQDIEAILAHTEVYFRGKPAGYRLEVREYCARLQELVDRKREREKDEDSDGHTPSRKPRDGNEDDRGNVYKRQQGTEEGSGEHTPTKPNTAITGTAQAQEDVKRKVPPMAWSELPCWVKGQSVRQQAGLAEPAGWQAIQQLMVPGVKGCVWGVDVTALRRRLGIASLASGSWVSGTVLEVVGEVVLAWIAPKAERQLLFVTPSITAFVCYTGPQSGPPAASSQKAFNLLKSEVDKSMGVVDIDRERHWVAFGCDVEQGSVRMNVVDGNLQPSQSMHFTGKWNGKSAALVGNRVMPDKYGPYIIQLTEWHCKAWSKIGSPVKLSIQGLGQQDDGWMCGRWAIINMSVLAGNMLGGNYRYPAAAQARDVEQVVLDTAQAALCTSNFLSRNLVKIKQILIDI